MTPKAGETKEKINWTSSKLKTFLFKNTIKDMKTEPKEEAKLIANQISESILDYIKTSCNSIIKTNLKSGKGSV